MDETRAFEDQMNSSNAIDITLTYRINNPTTAHIFALQVKNIFCKKYSYDYSYKTNSSVENKKLLLFQTLATKLSFDMFSERSIFIQVILILMIMSLAQQE